MKPGDRVIHRMQPDWGVGEILATSAGGKVRVYFVYAGEKVLKNAPLEPVSGADAQHRLLDNRRAQDPREGIVRKTIPEATAAFLAIFPRGFSDPKYLEHERDYKLKAHRLMRELLGPEPLAELVSDGDFEETSARAQRVVNSTNLIFPNEKMALRDGLNSSETNRRRFMQSLYELLYGTSAEESRFNAWSEVLFDLEASKWTNATYFQFLAHPDRCIFVKPAVTRDAADVLAFELNYRPDLNWLTYQSVQRFAEILRDEIASLDPRDMIDVQSFIWCIAPGKYD